VKFHSGNQNYCKKCDQT